MLVVAAEVAVNLGRIVDGVKLGLAFVRGIRDALRSRNEPPIRIDDLHVGATTEDAVEREREKARELWPEADTTRLPRPPRTPRP